jgi:hypothetical protein
MRNEMHNYLYHQNKKLRSEDVISESSNDVYFEEAGFEIDFKVIRSVCSCFRYYSSLAGEVAVELGQRGFTIVGSIGDGGTTIKTFDKAFKDDLLDRLCGAVIWKSREYSLL